MGTLLSSELETFNRDLIVNNPKTINILFVDQQFRDGKATIVHSVYRDHGLPRALVSVEQVTETGPSVSYLLNYVSL